MFTYFVASPTEWSRGLIRRRGDLFAPVLPRLVRSQDILLRPRVVGLGRPKNSVGVFPAIIQDLTTGNFKTKKRRYYSKMTRQELRDGLRISIYLSVNILADQAS